MKARCKAIILLSLFITALMGCKSIPKQESLVDNQQVARQEFNSEHSEEASVDPYESANRKTYSFTDSIDRFILEPIADAYIDYVPYAIQRPISNFYRNLSYPNVALNAFLQGKFRQGFQDSFRFVINSTIGIFGLADMAGHMGFKENNEDFGQTLAVWGLIQDLTFLFPSMVRVIAEIFLIYQSDFLQMHYYMQAMRLVAP